MANENLLRGQIKGTLEKEQNRSKAAEEGEQQIHGSEIKYWIAGGCGGVCMESVRGRRTSLPPQHCWECWAWGPQRGPQSKRQPPPRERPPSGGAALRKRAEHIAGSERCQRRELARAGVSSCVPAGAVAGSHRRSLCPPPQLLLLGGGCQKAAPNYSRFPRLSKAGALGWLTPVFSAGSSIRVTPGAGEKMHCAGAGGSWRAKPSEQCWGG